MCGECCRQIVMIIKGLHPDFLKYLRAHGFKEDRGFVLIPHDCQHLKPLTVERVARYSSKTGERLPEEKPYNSLEGFVCDIHDSPDRPRLCKAYHGQKQIGRFPTYRPPGCTMAIR